MGSKKRIRIQSIAQSEAVGHRPRILFLSFRFPYPLIGGDRLKSFHLLRHLATFADIDLVAEDEAGTATIENAQAVLPYASVDCVPFSKLKATVRVIRGLFSRTPLEFVYYNDGGMRGAVEEALSQTKYDLIVCFILRTAQFVRNLAVDTPKLLVAEDARVLFEERATQRFSFGPQYLIRKIDALRLVAYEPRAMSEGFAKVTFVTDTDEQRLHQALPSLPTGVLTNGVDLSRYSFYDGDRDHTIVFCGLLKTYHNDLMARRLLRMLPKIREQHPDVRAVIIGKSPTRGLRRLVAKTAGAELHADVPDIQPYIQRAKVFVHTQTVGTGIQNKLLETMALGTPIVTTPLGALGIAGMEDGTHAYIRTTDDEIVQATVELLSHPDEGMRLARNARALIEERYSWEHIYATLDQILEEIAPAVLRDRVASPTQIS